MHIAKARHRHSALAVYGLIGLKVGRFVALSCIDDEVILNQNLCVIYKWNVLFRGYAWRKQNVGNTNAHK